MRSGLLVLVTTALALASCGDEPPAPSNTDRGATLRASARSTPEPTRTVEQFLNDPDALRSVLQRCGNDPGALAATPDCVNAAAARRQRTADEMKQSLQ